jgi:transcriptional regulator GlxA family with amidase domain
MAPKTLGVLLFPEFELLDVFGPLEAFGHAKDWFRILTVAERPGPVTSSQGPRAVADHGFADCPRLDVLLVPGGMGTRREVDNLALVDWIARQARDAELTTSVCTGVSAGIDMALHVIGRIAGATARDEIATRMEYEWQRDAAHDPFAKVWGLV